MRKSALIYLAVFATGTAIGFLAARIAYKKYYEEFANEEIESVKETYGKARSYTKGETDIVEDPDGKALTRSSLDGARINKSEEAKRNYHLIQPTESSYQLLGEEEETDDKEDEDDEPRDAAGKTEREMNGDVDAEWHERSLEDIDRTQPYMIDAEEFTNEFEHHDKLSMYYYRGDDILCDDAEDIVDDPDSVIGFDALEFLETEPMCWVRNEPIASDFEIVSINKSYAETVRGVGRENNMTPRELYRKKKAEEEE